jgi:hypothetical protein
MRGETALLLKLARETRSCANWFRPRHLSRYEIFEEEFITAKFRKASQYFG